MKVFGRNIDDWKSHDYDGSSDLIWYRRLTDQRYINVLSVHKVYQDNFCHIEFGGDILGLSKIMAPDIYTIDIEQAKATIDNILLRLSKLEVFT